MCNCMICPNCGAHEIDNCENQDKINVREWKWNIKPFKVNNDSHCLKCDCWFDINGKIVEGGKK